MFWWKPAISSSTKKNHIQWPLRVDRHQAVIQQRPLMVTIGFTEAEWHFIWPSIGQSTHSGRPHCFVRLSETQCRVNEVWRSKDISGNCCSDTVPSSYTASSLANTNAIHSSKEVLYPQKLDSMRGIAECMHVMALLLLCQLDTQAEPTDTLRAHKAGKAILEMLHIDRLSGEQRSEPHPYMMHIYQLLDSQEAADPSGPDGTLVQSFRSLQGRSPRTTATPTKPV